MSKNLQQIQVSGGVITPDKLFTDNILETRLKAAEEAKMLDKRLAASEKEGELSRDLTKTQYEAQNLLARDKLAADVADQTSRLALLKDQDTRQAALHGMQLGEAGMKLEAAKLAAEATAEDRKAEKAYTKALQNPDEMMKEIVKGTRAGSTALADYATMQDHMNKVVTDDKGRTGTAFQLNIMDMSPEDQAVAKAAMPAALIKADNERNIVQSIADNTDVKEWQDATRGYLARITGKAPTTAQVTDVVGNRGVDIAALQGAADKRILDNTNQLSLFMNRLGVNDVPGKAAAAAKAGDPLDVTESFSSFIDSGADRVKASMDRLMADGNLTQAQASAAVSMALANRYGGDAGNYSGGKLKVDANVDDIVADAQQYVGKTPGLRGDFKGPAMTMDEIKTTYLNLTARPDVRQQYADKLSSSVYGGSSMPSRLNPTTAASSKIGSTYDDYMQSNARSYGKALQDEGMAPDMARIEQLLGTDLKKGQVYQDYAKDYIINRNPDLPIENMTLEQVQEKVLPRAISVLKSRIANAVDTAVGDGYNTDTSEADAFYNRLVINGSSPAEARVARDKFINNNLMEMRKELQRLEAYKQ